MGMPVAIFTTVLDEIVAHAAREHPREACGLLLGGAETIEAAIPAANVADDPRRAFEIDPAALLRVHREARAGGRRLIGWYHSHPAGAAVPSAVDALRADEDDRLWMIAAGGDVRAYRACVGGPLHGRFAPVDLLRLD